MAINLDQRDAQTIIFTYPRAMNYGMGWGRGGYGRSRWGEGEFGYIRPEIKLEFGARGENDPSEVQTFVPYLAEEFPDLLPDAICKFPTLNVERTYWEKVTILHALHHNPKTGDRLSRHYYDTVMLDRGGISDRALPNLDLLAQVVRNKSLMFKEPKASYETAVIGMIKLLPTDEYLAALRGDYNAMSEMFMDAPPSFDEIIANLNALEDRINGIAN